MKNESSTFNIKKIPLVFLIGLGLFLITFSFLLINQYFQQDEWHSFGLIQSYGLGYVTLDKPIWISLISDRIGARFIMYSLFSVFNVNSIPYGIFALSIHLLNSFLLFLFALKITKSKLIASASSLFFLVNSVSDQAYSWFGTMAGSATSVTFILLSLIFYYKFLEKRKYLDNLFAVVLLWISFLFKEVGYFLFIVYPLLWFIYTKNRSLKLFIKDNLLIIVYGVIMTIFFFQSVLFIPGVRANYIAPQASGFIKVINHAASYPLEGISQIFLPPSVIFNLAKYFTPFVDKSLQPDTPSFDLFYTTTMAEYTSVGLSIILIIFLIIAYERWITKLREDIKLLFISSFLILTLSFVPYIAIDKFDAYLDSRYYYSVLIGASIVLGIVIFSVTNLVKNIKCKKVAIILFIILFIYHGVSLIKNQFGQFTISHQRISVIKQIEKMFPTLPQKTVFYVTGNNSGYYAIPELKVPFQSGFGQVLMTIYAPKNPIYPLLFKEKTFSKTADDGGFLYDTLAQGYREINGVGFGYFYDKEILKEALSKKLFNEKSVIFLLYKADENKIEQKDMADFDSQT